MSEIVRIEQHAEHVRELILSRPDRGNALSVELMETLHDALLAADADPEVRAVLLRGEGKHFCTGLDLAAAPRDLGPVLRAKGAVDRLEIRELVLRMQRWVGAPAQVDTPVIAAIHGWCIGGGLDLIASADIRLCTAEARFSLREGRLAMVADLGSLQRLPRIIGDAATRELALTAKDIDASRALALGLVSQVLDDQGALLDAARQEASLVATLSPLVTRGIKGLLRAQDGLSIDQGLDQVATWNAAFIQSQDLMEAFAAFMQRREPVYEGR